jgi:hypothetical protein
MLYSKQLWCQPLSGGGHQAPDFGAFAKSGKTAKKAYSGLYYFATL